MTKHSTFRAKILILVFLSTMARSVAQESRGTPPQLLSNPMQMKTTGILTNRLSPRQMRVWQSILRIVFAEEPTGRLLHPTLHSLWQRVENSGHAVYIEMPPLKGSSGYSCGVFSVEKSGEKESIRTGRLRLYLSVIENASTSGRFRRENGFAPFENLRSKSLRFAEVLGHELVHALLTLGDAKVAQLAQEMDKEMADLQIHRLNRKGESMDQQTRDFLQRIQTISAELEKQAEAVEAQIWRELVQNQN